MNKNLIQQLFTILTPAPPPATGSSVIRATYTDFEKLPQIQDLSSMLKEDFPDRGDCTELAMLIYFIHQTPKQSAAAYAQKMKAIGSWRELDIKTTLDTLINQHYIQGNPKKTGSLKVSSPVAALMMNAEKSLLQRTY